MNAAVLADGHDKGGARGRASALGGLLARASRDAARFSPFQRSPLDVLLGRWTLDYSPVYRCPRSHVAPVLALRSQPARRQSAARDPCRDASTSSGWRKSPIKLFITATNVRTGRGRVFRNAELTPDVLLASACLPTMFQAIEIDGEAYWDGGYAGNPTITPLVRECVATTRSWCRSIRVERPGTPRSAREILNRLNEVSFNAALMKELRMIALLRQVADPGNGEGALWARHAHPPHLQRDDDRSRLFLQAQRRMGLPDACCATRAAAARRRSWRSTARIWPALDRSTSTSCWRSV